MLKMYLLSVLNISLTLLKKHSVEKTMHMGQRYGETKELSKRTECVWRFCSAGREGHVTARWNWRV